MKRLGNHIEDCAGCKAIRERRRKTVWMTPQLEDQKVFFVCADPYCSARLLVVNLKTVKLPRL